MRKKVSIAKKCRPRSEFDNASSRNKKSSKGSSARGTDEGQLSEKRKLPASVRWGEGDRAGSWGKADAKRLTADRNASRGKRERYHLTAKSDILRQAARAVDRLVEARRTERKGISLKSVTLGKGISNKRAVYAVTVETLKYYRVLEELIKSVDLDSSAMSAGTCCVLAREIVMGSGVSRVGKAEKIVLGMEGELKLALENMISVAGVTGVAELLPKNEMEEAANKRRRTLRVNTLQCSIEMAIETLGKTVRMMNLV